MIQNTPPRPQGTHEWLVERLRALVISGAFTENGPLKQDDIARQFQVSRIPLREALRTLAAEGWVDLIPNRGAFVVPLAADDAAQLFEARAAVEMVSAGHSLPRMTAEDHSRLEAAHRALTEAPPQSYFSAHKAFHLSLHAGASPRLQKLIALQMDASERYLRLEARELLEQDADAREHEQFLEAALSRDLRAFGELIERHVAQSGKAIAGFLEEHARRAAA